MVDRRADDGQRVSTLELFFDLVVVFAITQVTALLSRDPTWMGLLRAMLVLAMLWWAWSAYAWLTNTLDPEADAIRVTMLGATAAMLVVSLAAPGVFGRYGVLFGVAYLIVRALHLLLLAIAGRGDRDLVRAVARTAPTALLGAGLLIGAGFLDGPAQLACWLAALAITYLGALLGHMRGWRVSPAHFVERFGLIVIIALGEAIVAIGIGAAGLRIDAALLAAALLAFVVSACLWWAYFDWVIFVADATLAELTGRERAALARDAYSYLHLPMVGGIVVFAFGVEVTLRGLDHSLAVVPAVCLCGGVALYFLAHVGLRLRVGGGLGHGRPIAAVVLLALIPVATTIQALMALALVAFVCLCLIVYEVARYRETRAWIRGRRGTFTQTEALAQGGGAGGGPEAAV
jgi:low temperature requirement protein LtrA